MSQSKATVNHQSLSRTEVDFRAVMAKLHLNPDSDSRRVRNFRNLFYAGWERACEYHHVYDVPDTGLTKEKP